MLLWSLSSTAWATEPVECSCDEYDFVVTINLGDRSFGGYLLYQNNQMISSGWSSKPVFMDFTHRKILISARDLERNLDMNLTTFEDGTGTLTVNNKESKVHCDWSAWEE